MIRAVTAAAMAAFLLIAAGCGGAAGTDFRSPTVSSESQEFKDAKVRAESIEKANREAERKAAKGVKLPD